MKQLFSDSGEVSKEDSIFHQHDLKENLLCINEGRGRKPDSKTAEKDSLRSLSPHQDLKGKAT